jgi:mRNA interferase RelE/StbE
MLDAIPDRRLRELLTKRMRQLEHDPDKQGKPLGGELAGYRSVRAAGQGYRILYRLYQTEVVVMVVALGRRRRGDKRDVYEVARRLFDLGLLDKPEG